jgi:hypothetical protein
MKQLTQKHKGRSQIRQFTRKDVEDCFDKFWGAAFRAPGDTVTIKNIALLSNITPPTWRVDYCVDHADTGFHYHDTVLLMQHSWTTSGCLEWDLTAPKEQDLPEGCATVQEEDARLRQQRCARAAQDEEGS